MGLAFTVLLAGSAVGVLPYGLSLFTRLMPHLASDDVAEAFKEARSLAMSRHASVLVLINEDQNAVVVEGGRWRKLPRGIALAGPAPERDGPGGILFHPDGSSSGGQVVVSSRGHAVSLVVDRGEGRVRRVEANPG